MGSPKITEAPTSRASASTRPRKLRVGNRKRSGVRSMRNPASASHALVAAWGVVSTVVAARGSRDHSSQRYDWIPPTFGGKSLVTSSELTSGTVGERPRWTAATLEEDLPEPVP